MVIFITLGIALMAASLASFDTWLYILVSRKSCVHLCLRFKTGRMNQLKSTTGQFKYDQQVGAIGL